MEYQAITGKRTVAAISDSPAQKTPLFVRDNSLDVIRALAVLLVVFNHLHPLVQANPGFVSKVIRQFFYTLSTGGWVGVDLFFVLSGFLVSGLLIKEYQKKQSIDAKRFLIRRGFKIYPSFILFIGLTYLIDKTFFGSFFHFPGIDYVKDLAFVHNYLGGRWDHTWSLDVEEFFYFFLTAIFLLTIKFKRFTFKVMCGIYFPLLAIGIGARLIANINHPAYDFTLHFSKTHFRLDALFLGVLISYLYHYQKEELSFYVKKYKKLLTITSVLFLLPNFFLPYWTYPVISVLFLSLNPFFFGILLLVVLNSKSSFFDNRYLAYIGKHSYCIYLWHVAVNLYLTSIFQAFDIAYPFNEASYWLLYMFLYITLSLLLGIVFTAIVEKPFITLRDKLYPNVNQHQNAPISSQ